MLELAKKEFPELRFWNIRSRNPQKIQGKPFIKSRIKFLIVNLYLIDIIYENPMFILWKRGPKPQFINVACPNKDCELHGLTGQGNVVGNGTYISRGEKTRRYLCHHCGKAFNDHTGTFYHDLRKDEKTIDLALKMSMKGMSIEAIADVLEVQLPV